MVFLLKRYVFLYYICNLFEPRTGKHWFALPPKILIICFKRCYRKHNVHMKDQTQTCLTMLTIVFGFQITFDVLDLPSWDLDDFPFISSTVSYNFISIVLS